MNTPFSDFEDEIEIHLNGMLGAGGFVAERDIHAITVNRWAHGYACEGSDLFDEEDVDHVARQARIPFGQISIANSDAGASAYMDAAINQAARAVSEFDFS